MIEITRRLFFKLLALGTTTLATESTAREKAGYLIPYVIAPEKINPVLWSTVATTCRECPAGCGIHMRHRDGRITKAEGNPSHPLNRGGLCARGQSSLQGVYDPDRLKVVVAGNRKGGFEEKAWGDALPLIARKLQGGRAAVMSRLETGTLAEIISGFAGAFGPKRQIFYEAFNYGPLKKANGALLGSPVVPYYRLDKCDYILSFAADFLETWVSNVQFAYEFASIRAPEGDDFRIGRIGRFVYVGPRYSMTAVNADDFVQVPPGSESAFALAVLKTMEGEGLIRQGRDAIAPLVKNIDLKQIASAGIAPEAVAGIARDFAKAQNGVALAGPQGARGSEAERLAAAVVLLNYAAGHTSGAIDLSRPHALSAAADEDEINNFLESITADDVLFILNTNPVYSRPGSEARLSRAGMIVYCGTMFDETARIADWVLPASSYLESWGDYEPYRGINGMIQPTMRPLYDTRETGDVLIELAAAAGSPLARGSAQIKSSYDWLQARWSSLTSDWKETLRQGGAWPQKQAGQGAQPQLRAAGLKNFTKPEQQMQGLPADQARLWLWAPVMLYDGRVSNRGWLQENPEPVSYIAWGNCVDVHPEKAKALGIRDEDIVELTAMGGQTVRAPARVTKEVAPDTVALAFGQGHTGFGMVADNLGANAYALMPARPEGAGPFGIVSLKKTGKKENLCLALGTREQHGRELLQWKPLKEARTMQPGPLRLPLANAYTRRTDVYVGHRHVGHRWAMVIDLQRCIGCGACEVACYAENNLPVTGKHRTRLGRNMPWIRVIPYREPGTDFLVSWLPLPCQHCDSAPCEPVCPVFAAVNNEEGLNAQIYNRCIGTRYCSNNCPYKVRRFNWFDHAWRKPLDWQLNPEVTVRCRGVMEKCTFCVQRIRNAEYRAIIEKRKLKDGEIIPACVQTCPARVFTFGDLLDPESEVYRKTMFEPRRYHVLEELNTKPAVTYLFRIKQET